MPGEMQKSFRKEVPTVFTGCWKAPDGSIGVAVSNTNEEPVEIEFEFDPAMYGLSRKGSCRLITDASEPLALPDYDATAGPCPVRRTLPACTSCVMVFESAR